MKTPGFKLLLTFCAISLNVSVQAQAAERFSVQDWKESFAKAFQSGKQSKIQELSNLQSLEKKAIPACVDCENKKKMAKAREIFSKGDYTGAEILYYEIPKGSDLWLEAVEERGWSHFRKEEFEKALAQTKTLLSPQFASAVNTEAFFLQSLSQLQICDYEGILKTHQTFKEKHRARLVEMQNLAKTGVSEAVKKAIKDVDHFPLKYEDFGSLLTQLPLLFYRDIEVQKQLFRLKISQAALSVIPDMDSSKERFLKINDESTNLLQKRLKILAERESAKNAKMIQKLNLIEVEAIQRIHTDMKLSKNHYKQNRFKKVDEDKLVFMDDGRPWIDELDKYDVVAKSCIKGIRRKM